MARKRLTDQQVEMEIEKLNQSEEVKLARKKKRIDYARRQYLYNLRALHKEGAKLMAAGITEEMLEEMGRDLEV